MPDFTIQKVLWEKYEGLKSKNPSYSQRSFAKKCELSSGALSNIMQGKRKVSKSLAIKIFSQLELNDHEWSLVLNSAKTSKKSKKSPPKISPSDVKKNDDDFFILEMEKVKVISDWIHYALLSLIKIKPSPHTPQKFAHRLDVSEVRVLKALQRLEKLGLITYKRGKWIRTKDKLATPDEFQDIAIRQLHLQNLNLAQEKIYLPIEERDFTATTFAVSTARLSDAKKLIRNFHAQMSELLEGDDANEVYKLSVQLFPLTTLSVQ